MLVFRVSFLLHPPALLLQGLFHLAKTRDDCRKRTSVYLGLLIPPVLLTSCLWHEFRPQTVHSHVSNCAGRKLASCCGAGNSSSEQRGFHAKRLPCHLLSHLRTCCAHAFPSLMWNTNMESFRCWLTFNYDLALSKKTIQRGI